MLLVIVYVGAVAVLFLFVVMMLDIDFAELRAGFVKNFPLGLLLAAVLLVRAVRRHRCAAPARCNWARLTGGRAAGRGIQHRSIGALLHALPFLFEAAGILLLVAMIGAIVLTHRQRGGVRGQNMAKQVARRPEEATINVKPEVGKGVSL
jgi:NADH-quinone oxidoreductase subunit J